MTEFKIIFLQRNVRGNPHDEHKEREHKVGGVRPFHSACARGRKYVPMCRIVDHDHSRNGDSPEDVKGKNTFVCFYCITHNFRCVKLVLGCCQRLCALIYEVGNGHIWDTGVGCQSDFTGAAVGVTDADAGSLYLWTELTQGVGIQFGIREASVAGKAAATYLFRHR